MALGAGHADILRLVVGRALMLTGAGMLTGLAGSLLLTRFMANLLYGVSPTDPRILILVATALTLVALLACYIPARRATKLTHYWLSDTTEIASFLGFFGIAGPCLYYRLVKSSRHASWQLRMSGDKVLATSERNSHDQNIT
jgi:hypothetical protein